MMSSNQSQEPLVEDPGHKYDATTQVVILGLLGFCGPGLFNALNGLGNAGSDSPTVAALANGCLYCAFAVSGYLSGAAFNLFGPKVLFSIGGCSYAVYAVCIYFTPRCLALAAVGGVVLGVGAGLFWAAQGSLMMAYATPRSRGRLIALFWVIFNLGGVAGGLLQFGLNFHTEGGAANPLSYFAFVMAMLASAATAPCVLAQPSSVVRDDGSHVHFETAESPWDEVCAAVQAIHDPFIQQNLLFFLASNWFYTYNFNGFNGHQFNVRTRGLNSAIFWGAQMIAAWLYGGLLDREGPPAVRATRGMTLLVSALAISMTLALWGNFHGPCNAGLGWDKALPCQLDFAEDFPLVLWPMLVFGLLGAADAMYQTFAYWLMSTTAGSDVQRMVRYAAVYKGVQSLGAGAAWLLDLPTVISYRAQGILTLALALGACIPVWRTMGMMGKSQQP